MQIFIKALVSLAVIFMATGIGKKIPSIGGLIAVMPLTGALILVWMAVENKGDPRIMQKFTQGAFWGIFPTLLFFLTALICYKKQMALPMVMSLSFGAWFIGALVHQALMRYLG
jgi:uncharacterized membrane protein (GlpM family)